MRCGALALIVGAASPAAAQAPAGSTSEPNGHVDLSWVRLAGAEDCPPPDLMRASVADLLDHDPFAGSGGEPYLRVEGVASRPGAGWTAVVFFRDGEGAPLGSRDITGGSDSCEPLAKAVVFAIALTIDPRVGLEADATSVRLAEPEPEPEPAPETAPPAEAAATPPEPDQLLPGASVTAGPLLSAGTLPGGLAVGAGVGVRGPLYLDIVSWGVGAFFFGFQETDEISVSLGGGWLEACVGGAPWGVLEVRACPRFVGGVMDVALDSAGFMSVSPGTFSWFALGVAFEALVPIVGPLALSAEVAPLVSLSARDFTAGSREQPLYSEERIALMAHLGVAYVF